MSILRGVFAFIISIAAILFAISNRHTVAVFFTPFHPSIELPLYFVALGLMAAGFFIGSILVWMNESPLRRDRRTQKKRVRILEKELESAAQNQTAPAAPSSDFFPALPLLKK